MKNQRTGKYRPLTQREKLAKRIRWESAQLAAQGLAPALPLLRKSGERGSVEALIVAALVRRRRLTPSQRERVASFLAAEEARWSEVKSEVAPHRLKALGDLREALLAARWA